MKSHYYNIIYVSTNLHVTNLLHTHSAENQLALKHLRVLKYQDCLREGEEDI